MFTKYAVVAFAALSFACSAAPQDGTTEDGSDEIVSKSAHFETFVGQDGQHYFSLVAANGQNVLRSEGYKSTSGMNNGIASVVTNAVDPGQFQILEASDGEWYFNVVAANHEIIGTSEMYATKYNAQRGAGTVRALANLLGAQAQEQSAAHAVRYEVFQGEDKKFYFHLRAGNGEIVLASQGYTAKASAQNGVASVNANGATATKYEIIDTADGRFAFHLKAANGQIIAKSETYVSESNAQRGIDTCVSIIGSNPVVQ
jgi:uncharacterized protein YegP (UPF0339 family)